MANSATGSNIVRTEQVHPTFGRIIVAGHSWVSPYQDGTTSAYQTTNPNDPARPRDQAMWTQMLRERFTPQAERVLRFRVPPVAQATTQTTMLDLLPEDAIIEGVWYVPNADVTGANTDTRKVEFKMIGGAFLTVSTMGSRQFDLNSNLTAGVPQAIVLPVGADLVTPLWMGAGAGRQSWWNPSVVYTISGTGSRANPMMWVSTAVGAGLADPGGTVHVRIGGRFRNLGQFAAKLLQGGAHRAGWSSQIYAKSYSRGYGIEVSVATTAATSATTLLVGEVPFPIANAARITFSNGVTATLTAAAAQSATSLTVSALSGGINAGEHGFAIVGGFGSITAYEPLTPEGAYIFMWGANDAAATIDRVAWRETMRYVIALASCPVWNDGNGANSIRAAGNGASAAWAAQSQLAGGRWWYTANNPVGANLQRFTGAVGATKPTITRRIMIPRDTAFIDTFFMCLCGTSRGAQGTIAIDGGTAVVFDTSSASPLQGTSTASVTTNGTTTVTGTGFTPALIGQVIEKADIPKATTVSGVATAGTSLTLSASATGSTTSTATFVDWVPMVKRMTNSGAGYATGAHTVVITITAIDATDGSAMLLDGGYGLEVPTVVRWCNIARTPGANVDTEIQNYNTDSAAVIAGTAAAFGTNTAEGALGSLAEIVDIDAALNHDAAYFNADGTHLTTAGHQILDTTITASLTRVASRTAIAR